MDEEEQETLAWIRNQHYIIAPYPSPENLDDTSWCSCGEDLNECNIRVLLDYIDRLEKNGLDK